MVFVLVSFVVIVAVNVAVMEVVMVVAVINGMGLGGKVDRTVGDSAMRLFITGFRKEREREGGGEKG